MFSLVDQFREKVSKLKDYRMKQEMEFGVGYPTQFLNFDFRNGTKVSVRSEELNYEYYSIGIVDGSMNMFIGRSGSGKTTFAVQIAANIIRPFENGKLFFDSVEGGISAPRLELLTKFRGDELRDRCVVRDAGVTAENFYERLKMLYDLKMENRQDLLYFTGLHDTAGNQVFKLQPTVYLLDSLALLMPEKFTEEDELSGQMSATATAKANALVFKRIIPMLKMANIILIVINHINQKVDINPMQRTKSQVSYLKQGETLPGGNAPIYLSNNIVRFDDSSKLKSSETFGIDGNLTDLVLVKSRTNKAGQSATVVFDQDNGFDPELSLFILLKEYGRVKGAGAYLYIGDYDKCKFSQKNFKAKLKEDVELQRVFANEVLDVLTSSLNKISEEETEEIENDFSMSNIILNKLNSSENSISI